MAIWSITRTKQNITVIYRDPATGKIFDCGPQRLDTPISLIADWVSDQSAPGDMIVVNNQLLLTKMQEARA